MKTKTEKKGNKYGNNPVHLILENEREVSYIYALLRNSPITIDKHFGVDDAEIRDVIDYLKPYNWGPVATEEVYKLYKKEYADTPTNYNTMRD